VKYVFCLMILAKISLFANNIAEKEKSKNPEIQVNVQLSNSHDEAAPNTTITTAKQHDSQVQQQIVTIKDERSLLKTIVHAAAATLVPIAIHAIKNSTKVAEAANRIISQFS
jgi:lipopolysaccharide export LptBFGC system permease protein LptF